jgi:DNA (cytosine-5)-methyltransferase 1
MRTLTLFAGAGGADIGLQRAGVQHLACIEGDANACATLRAAGFQAVHAWIGTPPPGSSLTGWWWDGGPVDLLWASPPCQPYSFAGDRLGADDPRDGWPATLEAIRTIRPRWVIIENVGGSPIEAWAADLGPSMFRPGLYPHVSTRFLDAADWGLPSHRRREFLVAGPTPYRWPEPTHCGPDAPVAARMRLLPWVGFGEALGIGPGATMLPGNGGHLPAPRCASEPAHTVTGSCPQYLMQPAAGVCTTEVKGTRASASSGFTFSGGPDRASDSLFLATGRRRLTWQECATLVGFPDGYPFQGTIEARYRQVGNAVAPIMAEVLARSIPREAP